MNDWHNQAFYRISAIGLIRNAKNEILMVNEHGHFTLPGGGWDYGETLHEALKRELYEEVQLESDFYERVITAIPFYNSNKNAWQMWLACDILYDELQYGVGEHASEVRWFSEAEIDTTTKAGELTKQVLEIFYERS